MNQKRIERLIPKAIAYIEANFLKGGSVPKVYQGYLASFGPTVISSGLLMAVAFNSDEKKSENRKVMALMFALMKEEMQIEQNSLLDFLKRDENYKKYHIKHLVLDANIASKLAIRTFDLKD